MTSDNIFHFNLVAETWSRTAVLDAAVVQALLDAADMPTGSCVLDAGCGPGLLLPSLLKRVGPSGRIVALDNARRMLAIAARKHADPRIRYICSDLTAYTGIDGPFDTVVCCRFLHHLPNPLQAVKKMSGWLRAGGRLIVMHELDDLDSTVASQTVSDLRQMLSDAGLALEQELAVANWSILTGQVV